MIVRSGTIAILGAVRPERFVPAADALLGGAITIVEITLTTPGAQKGIAEARQQFGERVYLGPGESLVNRQLAQQGNFDEIAASARCLRAAIDGARIPGPARQ